MKCEKCNKEHNGAYGSGRFCSESCARSFSSIKNTHNSYKEAYCPECGNKHLIKLQASSKTTLCSDCGGRGNKRIDGRCLYGICIFCGKKLKKSATLFCNNKCRFDYTYYILLNKWKLKLISGCKKDYGVRSFIRRYFFEKYNNKCQKCGWGKVNPTSGKIPLTLHHVDGNCLNNSEENLELLCPNCHSLTNNYGSLNKTNKISRYERLFYK